VQKRDNFDNDPNSASVYDNGMNVPFQRTENKRAKDKVAALAQFNQMAIQSEADLNMVAQDWVAKKAAHMGSVY
jgi:hypothetical protein